MRRRNGLAFPLLVGILVGAPIPQSSSAEDSTSRIPTSKRAIEAVAPEVKPEILAAIQEGRYVDAIAALDLMASDKQAGPDDRAYFALIRGTAQRLAGQLDDARTTLKAAIATTPKGTWTAKLRSELAAVEVAAGRFREAEPIARAEAERLLAPGRKDRLAEVYQVFALRLLKSDDPIRRPDPEAAHALLNQARGLAKGQALRASLRFAMARASREANNPARTIEDLQAYLDEFPDGADRTRARFQLGEAQLAAGQGLPARLTWSDLARDLQDSASRDKAVADLRARALYQIARTHGIPAPLDDAQLGLGVAALRRFLETAPEHPLAVRAAAEIGASYLARGKSQEALDALTSFLKGNGFKAESDEAKKDLAELSMTATFQVGQVLQGQEKFAEAIDAFKGYLARFPDGPASAGAQRGILDTELFLAQDLLRQGRHAEARAAWQAFATQNPLDARVPEVLFQVGASFAAEKSFDEAIAAWETLAGKFPGSEAAAHALFQIASVTEVEKGDPASAIERFKKVGNGAWGQQARQRVAVMESRALTVVTSRAFRSGETAQLKIATRNLDRLNFRAYKLDPEEYFRKKHALKNVETLDIGLVAPDAEWTVDVPGYAKYKPIEADYDVKVAVPGVWVVKVSDEKTLQATTLVLGTDLEAIVKASRDQVLVFAEDLKSGQGRPDARVLVADGSGVILEGKTGPDGVLLSGWGRPRDPGAALDYLILDGEDVAGSGLGIPGQVAQGLSPRAYLYTDRPAYRPGQDVELRGVVREVVDGQYAHQTGAEYRLEVIDGRGRRIASRAVTLSPFGTFHERLPLGEAAAVGTYRVRLFQPGKSEFAGQFEVQAYQLEKVDLSFDLPRTVYYRGETIKTDLIARYQYGTPLADRPIDVQLPDGRTLHGRTDATGMFPVELPTDGFAEEQALSIVARLPEDNVAATATVNLAVHAFRIDLSTPRAVYLDGESFTVKATTLDAQGKPIGQELALSVLKRVEQGGRVIEREVEKKTLTTDARSGEGTLGLTLDDARGGPYLLRASGMDRFGNPVVAERALTISGQEDPTKLRILAERTTFKVGETAKVVVHSQSKPGVALLAWEADRILRYKLVALKEGDNSLSWDVDGPQFPNFTLTAARMIETHLHQAQLDVRVERDLRLELKPTKPSVGPGEPVEIDVATTDQLGHPVAAELSLALVDRALLRLHGDTLPAIGPFFHDQTRTGSFATESTIVFHYAPATVPVAEAIVEEAQRQAALAADVKAGGPGSDASATPGASVKTAKIHVDSDPRSQAIWTKLDQVVSMPFGEETMLSDVIKYIKTATADQKMPRGLPIFLDKTDLGEVEASEDSMIKIELEGVPLRTTLSLALKQLGLTYAIKDGVLMVVAESADGEDMSPADQPTTGDVFGGGMGVMGGGMTGMSAETSPGPQSSEIQQELSYSFQKRSLPRNLRGYSDGSEPEARFNKLPETEEIQSSKADFIRRLDAPPTAQPRQQFVETAYWNPSVVTGKDGKARITFRAPLALSEYRFTARGVTGAETLVGQTTADLAVRKGFFVDLKVPSLLTQGDKPRFSARLHHSGMVGKADVRLTIYAGGREVVQPKTIAIKGDGVDEFDFDPFEVPDGESVRLSLAARVGETSDELISEVPIRPWGAQAFASASGSARDDATVFVGLPPGRDYDQPEMLIVISPTLRRMIVELALDRDAYGFDRRLATCVFPREPMTTADQASSLLAATSALVYLKSTRGTGVPEAILLTDRIHGLLAELISRQNEDGGWPWVGGDPAAPSDRLTSARVVWALTSAEPHGLLPEPKALDKGTSYLTQEFARTEAGDLEARAALLHALSTRKQASFEAANALNRVRQDLPEAALAYLALTLAALDRHALADEVLGVLGPRARAEPNEPNQPRRQSWASARPGPWSGGPAETTALVALAFAKVRPQAPEVEAGVNWLLAHRVGTGWRPARARGPALAALAAFYAGAGATEDRYRLVVRVNDQEVHRVEVDGPSPGQAIPIPRKVLKIGDTNQVQFDMEGRGTFGYAVTLTGFTRDFGPDQDPSNRSALVNRRVELAVPPEFDGKTLPTGFSVAINANAFENQVSQVTRGGRARIVIDASRTDPPQRPSWERDYLILTEHLPAGTTLIDGSVVSQANHFEQADGVLTFHFAPDRWPGRIQYDVLGYLPGEYRVLPPQIRSASDPGRAHLGPAGKLTVLSPGLDSTDSYKATPDELYARGKALFDAGRLAQADAPLEELFGGYTLRDDVLKDAVRMLLFIHIQQYNPRKIVRDYEIVREKAPELFIPFDKILIIGRAYADIGEFERAFVGWRGAIEASYLEDAQVGETLRQRGLTLEGIAFLLDLGREYPDSASIQSDFFGMAQLLASLAGRATTDPPVRAELAAAGLSRTDLLRQAIRLIQSFLVQSPRDPLADEASLAWVGDSLELRGYEDVVKLSERFAILFPKSTFLDSFQYAEALGRLHLGQYERAIEVAEAIAKATYRDENGVDQPSPNKWQALYILGQIYDARRQPAEALEYYKQVADRFSDAADAVEALTRKELALPEVSVLRPGPASDPSAEKPAVRLTYRNIGEADVKVYPVDLLQLYLTRRNLNAINGIDLVGIRPLVETKVKLGDGPDFEERVKALDLPLKDEKAYLVMVRGDNVYTSGIVVVSLLEIEVREQPGSGRVRVRVRDARTRESVPDVQVKVIGSSNESFLSGQTDLRGVFVAEGVRGQVTAVARKGTGQFAFHRGPAPAAAEPDATASKPGGEPSPSLDESLRSQTKANQGRQIDRLQRRHQGGMGGGMGGMMGGGFR